MNGFMQYAECTYTNHTSFCFFAHNKTMHCLNIIQIIPDISYKLVKAMI